MNAETLKAKLAAIRQRDRASVTGDYDLARQWATGISTMELERELAEAECDANPVPIARIGGRVVMFQPVPPYKLTWLRALCDEMASRSDRQSDS